MDRATELARAAGLMLVVGSSLEVYPVAGLPLETLAAGGRVAIVNRGPTPLDVARRAQARRRPPASSSRRCSLSSAEYDVVVVGSGFGGSVAALRLTEKGYRVAVLEAGRRFGPNDFARTSWNLRRWLYAAAARAARNPAADAARRRARALGRRGRRRLARLRERARRAARAVLERPRLVGSADWRTELEPHYETVRRMLGAALVPWETAADRRRAPGSPSEWASPTRTGASSSACTSASPGVRSPTRTSAEPGRPVAAASPAGTAWSAAVTTPRTRSTATTSGWPSAAAPTSSPSARRSTWSRSPAAAGTWWHGARACSPRALERFRARQVVLAAGVLGTLRLLFAARERGRLPRLSPRLGERVRTNRAGARRRDRSARRRGPLARRSRSAPSSAQPPRRRSSPSATGAARTRWPCSARCCPTATRVACAPGSAGARAGPTELARSLSARRWSERTVILLVMQARDVRLRVTARRGRLRSAPEGPAVPSAIPEASRAARIAAELLGGAAGGTLGRRAARAHDDCARARRCAGRSVGRRRCRRPVRARLRVRGPPRRRRLDVSANLGANPVLTIRRWPSARSRSGRTAATPIRGRRSATPTRSSSRSRLRVLRARPPRGGAAVRRARARNSGRRSARPRTGCRPAAAARAS